VSKRALGKGIDALFQTTVSETEEHPGLASVPLARVLPNPNQPRKEFNEDALNELAASIRENGIIQPIIVEEQSDGMYMIVDGERRYRAARLAGLEEIPIIIRRFTEEEKLEIALIENIQREDLTPIEEAKAYKNLIDTSALSQEELATKIGKNRSTVANSLRLLKLPEDMQTAINNRELTAGHARAILAVVNPADQRIMFNRIMSQGLSVREAEDLSADLNKGIRSTAGKPDKVPKQKQPELSEIEQKLINRLGTKVTVRGTGRKGSIEISYFSMDDLERVVELLLEK
jgi:ParB family transcriptional regulator, chromosome partitioning protein